jgi:hypothetical protein
MLGMLHRSRLDSLSFTFAIGLGLALLGACEEDDEIGTPCETAEDCSGDLICDVHDGQGTCQEAHGH